ncbi:MAG: bacterial Ig-like domain-containing protein [Bacilli bacterium]|nr:bacterial Ig-like domain-containing protein [Bacilli bacterium]
MKSKLSKLGIALVGFALMLGHFTVTGATAFLEREHKVLRAADTKSYTLVSTQTKLKSAGTVSTSTKATTIFSDGIEFLADTPVSEATKCFYGDSANPDIRIGTSSAAGSLTLCLSESGKQKATAIIVNAKLYNSTKAANLSINESSPVALSSNYSDYEFKLDGSNLLETIALKSDKYLYVHSITVQWSDEEEKTLSSVSISDSPIKKTYIEGETLNPTGLVVTGTYSDGSEETITEGVEWIFDPETFSAGDTSCEVMAEVGDIVSDPYVVDGITVKEPVDLVSLEISGTPAKLEYVVGDTLDTAGLVVTGTYSDGSEETITEGIEWVFDPETFSAGDTSCEVMAGVGEIVSESYIVNNIVIKSYKDTYGLNGANKYIMKGERYLKTSGDSAAPIAVPYDSASSPSSLSFHLVGNDEFTIGSQDGSSLLYCSQDANESLRFGNSYSSGSYKWKISKTINQYTLIETLFNRQLSLCYDTVAKPAQPKDFRVYPFGNASATTVLLEDNLSAPSTVEINETGPIQLNLGSSQIITTVASGGTVEWFSSNENVVTLVDNHDGTCNLTAVEYGSSTITAYVREAVASVVVSVDAEISGDVLTDSFIGADGSYKDWTGKQSATNSYDGNSMGGSGYIQIRSSNQSGIISTGTGFCLKTVVVAWNTKTNTGRTLSVYGKNTPYTGTSDLYNSSNCGQLLGTIVCGSSTTLSINGSYEYIGIRSSDGAMYLDKIGLEWETKTISGIKNLSTSYSLKYKYNSLSGTFSDIELRYGALIDKREWTNIQSDVTEFGVVAIRTDKIGQNGATLKQAIQVRLAKGDDMAAAASAVRAQIVADDDKTKIADVVQDKEYVLFNGVASVPSLNHKNKAISAVAYVKVNGKYEMLKEVSYSVQTIAEEYLANPLTPAEARESLQAIVDYDVE